MTAGRKSFKRSQEDLDTIRRFLEYCLDDGYYVFKVAGEIFELDTKADLDRLMKAIEEADPPTFEFRLREARRHLDRTKGAQDERLAV